MTPAELLEVIRSAFQAGTSAVTASASSSRKKASD